MAKFGDSLRGYGHPIFKRDGFRCQYCGWEGSKWPDWTFLSVDHLLPPRHPDREQPEFKVTACFFCNTLANRAVFDVEGKTPAQLLVQKRPVVLARREDYHVFWTEHVEPATATTIGW